MSDPPESTNTNVTDKIEAARDLSDLLGDGFAREAGEHLAVGAINQLHDDWV